MEQPSKCPSADGQIKNWTLSLYIYILQYTHKYIMEYYFAIENNEVLPFAAIWIHLEYMLLTEISQTEKDMYCIISLICGIKKKHK